MLATGGIYDTLGLQPAAGRLLRPSDSGQSAADAQAVAVLSYATWQRRFGADPSAIGRTLRIEGTPFTIVGVTPPGFFGVAVGAPVDVTIPLTILPRLREEERRALTSPGETWLYIMGRLRPGVSLARADAEFQTVWPQILRATADSVDPGFRPRYLKFTSGLEPGASGYSPVRRQFQDALWLLFGLVGLLLVAACATVANLLLAAAAGRRHELALRLALGAARWRIVQQLFVEGLLLAVAGGVLGFLFSSWAADLLVGLLSTSYESVVVNVAPDGRVLAFVALVIGVATIVFTMAPIVGASRIDPGPVLDAGARQTGGLQRARTARALVAAQVAISLTLLAGSALFVRNLRHLLATDIGFDRENLLVVRVDAQSPLSASNPRVSGAADRMPYYAELLRRLRETPGVGSVSLSQKSPISNEEGWSGTTFAAEGGDAPPDPPDAPTSTPFLPAISPPSACRSSRDAISSGAIATARRASPSSTGRSPARYFGNDSPVGRHLLMDRSATRLEVVGVVPDGTYQDLREERHRIAYLPYLQEPDVVRDQNLVADVRVAGTPATIADSIRAAVRMVDPSAPLTIQSVRSRIDESLVGERLITVIAVFLGAVSLLLACGALGGVMSYLVTARTREIGLRLALGADRRLVLGLVMRQALTVATLGAIAGLGFTLAAGRLVSRFLTTIGPADPVALAAAAAILLLTTAIAGYLPARRAARVDPMVALRSE